MAKGKSTKGRGPGKWATSTAYRTVVATLVAARKDAGMTQRNLAQALTKPHSYIAKIDQRERHLDMVEFIAIARALAVKEE